MKKTIVKKERGPLNKAKIMDTALKMADKHGLQNLSMRSLGKELGVEAMSLYKHIQNKEEILDGLTDLLLQKIEIPSSKGNLKNTLKALYRNKRKILKAHPWAPQVLDTRKNFSEIRLNFMEKQFKLLRDDGYSITETYRILLALESYVYGFCIQESGWRFDNLPEHNTSSMENLFATNQEHLFTRYPNFVGFITSFLKRTTKKKIETILDEEFEYGLDVFIKKVLS